MKINDIYNIYSLHHVPIFSKTLMIIKHLRMSNAGRASSHFVCQLCDLFSFLFEFQNSNKYSIGIEMKVFIRCIPYLYSLSIFVHYLRFPIFPHEWRSNTSNIWEASFRARLARAPPPPFSFSFFLFLIRPIHITFFSALVKWRIT